MIVVALIVLTSVEERTRLRRDVHGVDLIMRAKVATLVGEVDICKQKEKRLN